MQVNGRQAQFTRSGDELRITPGTPSARAGTSRSPSPTAVSPNPLNGPIVFGSDYGWMKTPDGVFVACEPNAASTWFPSSDHPSDKATYDIRIKAPKGLTGVSNGLLVSTYSKGASTYTHWRESKPMATYLATATIGKFDVKTGRTPGGIPIYVAIDPVLANSNSVDVYAVTAAATDYWSQLFGPYPFRGDRRDRRRHARGRVLAGGAEQARLLGRAQRDDDRARAGPPVVRRLRVRRALEGHLAQRGLRDLRPVAVGRAPGHPHRARLVPG